MYDQTEKFYNTFCKKTQSKNGMWEQRFFTDGRLAPCWGYQIDETASVVYGVYEHYKIKKEEKFLRDNIKMCEKAIEFLIKYVKNLLEIEETDKVKKGLEEKYGYKDRLYKHVSYDLWEMNEGIHLYSLASICAAFNSMTNIYDVIYESYKNNRIKQEKIEKVKAEIEKYNVEIKKYILNNLYDDNKKVLKRNTLDENSDISILGIVTPFEIFSPSEKKVQNTVNKIEMTLRTFSRRLLKI